MAPTNVGYSFKEAISHFFRNWTTSLGAVITIFLSLFIIGLFIMGSAMLNSVIGTVEDQVVINAFISDDADQADVQAFEAELKTWNNVKSVTYKDKDDALAEYTSKMSGNADATMSALDGQNPLPASFAIEMDDPSKVESTAKKLKKNAEFQKIASGRRQQRLHSWPVYHRGRAAGHFGLAAFHRRSGAAAQSDDPASAGEHRLDVVCPADAVLPGDLCCADSGRRDYRSLWFCHRHAPLPARVGMLGIHPFQRVVSYGAARFLIPRGRQESESFG